jgi:hypothetical protein
MIRLFKWSGPIVLLVTAGDYTHVKAAASPTKEIAEKTDTIIREQSNSQDLDVRVDEVSVVDSEIGVSNQASNPVYLDFAE